MRHLPRSQGHRAGVESLKSIVRAAGEYGIEYLTLYSFSMENWSRPESEISDLFGLLKLFIQRDIAELHRNHVKVVVIGQRNGLPKDILKLLEYAEDLTANNQKQTLVIAFNYSGRDEIARAARKLAQQVKLGNIDESEITPEEIAHYLDTAGIPDPDLIIRTSGEKRLSNFLLWQAAYSEFVFAECLWPDFSKAEFENALQEYSSRSRRFGGLMKENAS